MTSVVRAFVISTVLVGICVLLLFMFRGWHGNEIGFMSVKVINDTNQTWRIQPCWDLNCDDTIGLHDVMFRPGEARRVPGQWANDEPEQIVIGILRPHAEAFHYDGCVLRYFDSGKKVGVIRLSQEGPCLNVPEGAGGNG